MRVVPILSALLLVAVGLPACTAIPVGEDEVFQNKPTLTPADFPRGDIALRDLYVPVADSVSLNAWHLTQPGARGTVVFFGGQGFFMVHAAGYVDALMQHHPVNLLMVDYRGYGKSGGTPSVEALQRDALDVVGFATDSLGVAPEQLVLHGHSLGTFVAVEAARDRSVAGVVLENPVTTAEGWADHLIPWYLRLFVRLEPSEALRRGSNVDGVRVVRAPLLVVAGGADHIADPAMARTLYEGAASPEKRLLVVEGGGHNRLFEALSYREAYARFLRVAWGEEPAQSAAKRQP